MKITYSPLRSCKWRWWSCHSFATAGPARRRSIHGWPWSGRPGLAYRRRRTLKNYFTNRRKATLIGNYIKTSLRRIITSLGRLGLDGLRHQALLCRCWKVHHLHLFVQIRGVLTSIQVPPFLMCLPLKYSIPTLPPSICPQTW